MTLGGRLDALRSGFPGCSLVAFVDLSTGMVLSASAVDATRQEELEHLCDAAVAALRGPEAERVQQVLDVGQSIEVFGLSAGGLQCFVRSPLVPEEALCMHCDVDVEIDALALKAAELLRAIGHDG